MQTFQKQIEELQKLSYQFYGLLSNGDEPLTYTIRESGTTHETQVEVNAQYDKSNDYLNVEISFDTNFGGRFDKSKKKLFHI